MEVYQSDDYAGLEVPGVASFYYGYEHTTNDGIDEDDTKWDEDDEWCFVAWDDDANEIARLTMTDIESSCDTCPREPNEYLLAGIGILIKRGTISL